VIRQLSTGLQSATLLLEQGVEKDAVTDEHETALMLASKEVAGCGLVWS
jgi:hypothetical protein